VLDLGAGTGKLTRVLARRFARVTAVEPDASMRALLGQVTDCHLALEGAAEAIPLADASVDGVFCAECFQWFAWPAALREIARVLRPRGILVLCFQMPDDGPYIPMPEEGWEIAGRYRRPGVEPGGAIVESGAWREPFDEPLSRFEPLRTESVAHVHVQTADEVVSRTSRRASFRPSRPTSGGSSARNCVPSSRTASTERTFGRRSGGRACGEPRAVRPGDESLPVLRAEGTRVHDLESRAGNTAQRVQVVVRPP